MINVLIPFILGLVCLVGFFGALYIIGRVAKLITKRYFPKHVFNQEIYRPTFVGLMIMVIIIMICCMMFICYNFGKLVVTGTGV